MNRETAESQKSVKQQTLGLLQVDEAIKSEFFDCHNFAARFQRTIADPVLIIDLCLRFSFRFSIEKTFFLQFSCSRYFMSHFAMCEWR